MNAFEAKYKMVVYTHPNSPVILASGGALPNCSAMIPQFVDFAYSERQDDFSLLFIFVLKFEHSMN